MKELIVTDVEDLLKLKRFPRCGEDEDRLIEAYLSLKNAEIGTIVTVIYDGVPATLTAEEVLIRIAENDEETWQSGLRQTKKDLKKALKDYISGAGFLVKKVADELFTDEKFDEVWKLVKKIFRKNEVFK